MLQLINFKEKEQSLKEYHITCQQMLKVNPTGITIDGAQCSLGNFERVFVILKKPKMSCYSEKEWYYVSLTTYSTYTGDK